MPKKKRTKVFSAMKDCQLRLTFSDGSSMSAIWGPTTYSDNHDYWPTTDEKRARIAEASWIGVWFNEPMESDTIEVMYDHVPEQKLKKIINKFGDSNPLGYLSFEDWLWLVKTLSKGHNE